MGKVLVTGSTGFVGKRLVYQLLDQNHEVYALTRFKGLDLAFPTGSNIYTLHGDLRDIDHVEPFPKEIEAAYYLLHSMGGLVANLKEEEESLASNFITLIEKQTANKLFFLVELLKMKRHSLLTYTQGYL